MLSFLRKSVPVQELLIRECRRDLRQKKLYPHYVQWIATHQCNFNCPHCGTNAGTSLSNELTTAEIMKVISALGKMKTQIFSITGGEPLLRDDIFDVINYATSLGMKVGIVSNGYMTEELVEKLKNTKLDGVLISIDGYRDNHDKIRNKKGSYERCLRSLKIYRELKINSVGVSTVVMEENVEDIPKIVDDVWKWGCTTQRLQPIVPEGRAVGRRIPPEVIKKAFKFVVKIRHQGINLHLSEGFGYLGSLEKAVRNFQFFCGCGWKTFTIMADGEVMGCPAMEFKRLSEGNIRIRSIEDIWQKFFKRFRSNYHTTIHNKCKHCKWLMECRGGCWLLQLNGDPCFLPEAEEVARELGLIKANKIERSCLKSRH